MTNTYYAGRLRNNANNTVTVTTTYTATTDDGLILCDATSAAFTVTLPSAASSSGKMWTFKKIDSTTNAVTIAGTVDGTTNLVMPLQYDEFKLASDGTSFYLVSPIAAARIRRFGRVAVSLITAAQTTIFTVPTGKTLYVYDTIVLGTTASTGSTKTSTLKIGTTTGSYGELLNGTTGMVQATGTATSILANNTIISANQFYPPATVSVAPTMVFAAGSVIKADVSTGGSLPTTGAVAVELIGYLA